MFNKTALGYLIALTVAAGAALAGPAHAGGEEFHLDEPGVCGNAAWAYSEYSDRIAMRSHPDGNRWFYKIQPLPVPHNESHPDNWASCQA